MAAFLGESLYDSSIKTGKDTFRQSLHRILALEREGLVALDAALDEGAAVEAEDLVAILVDAGVVVEEQAPLRARGAGAALAASR